LQQVVVQQVVPQTLAASQQVFPPTHCCPTAQHFPLQQVVKPVQQTPPQGRFGGAQQLPLRQGAVDSQQIPPQMVLFTPQQTLTPGLTSRQAWPAEQQIGSARPSANSLKPQIPGLPVGQQNPSGVQTSPKPQQLPLQPTVPGGQQVPSEVQTWFAAQQRPRQGTPSGGQQTSPLQTWPVGQQSVPLRHSSRPGVQQVSVRATLGSTPTQRSSFSQQTPVAAHFSGQQAEPSFVQSSRQRMPLRLQS